MYGLPSKYDGYDAIKVNQSDLEHVSKWCTNNRGQSFGDFPLLKGIIHIQSKITVEQMKNLGATKEQIELLKTVEGSTSNNLWVFDFGDTYSENWFKGFTLQISMFDDSRTQGKMEKAMEYIVYPSYVGDNGSISGLEFDMKYMSPSTEKALRKSEMLSNFLIVSPDAVNIEKAKRQAMQQSAMMLLDILFYVNNFVETKEIVRKETQQSVVSKNRKKKNKKPSVKKITRTVYKVSYDKDAIDKFDKEHRIYQRQAEFWNVKGHWRNYKNGKRVWIKPYSVNLTGKEVEKKGKVYKLGGLQNDGIK